MDKVLSKSRAVARSLDEQLDWVGWNPCYGRASRAVGDYLLWRETIIEEKAQQQHAAALDVYSPIFDSPPVTKASSTAGKAEPVRGVACMISASSGAHPAGRNTCMPSKGLGAHGCLHAPGMRAAYVS